MDLSPGRPFPGCFPVWVLLLVCLGILHHALNCPPAKPTRTCSKICCHFAGCWVSMGRLKSSEGMRAGTNLLRTAWCHTHVMLMSNVQQYMHKQFTCIYANGNIQGLVLCALTKLSTASASTLSSILAHVAMMLLLMPSNSALCWSCNG
jgi:hypothetical protein